MGQVSFVWRLSLFQSVLYQRVYCSGAAGNIYSYVSAMQEQYPVFDIHAYGAQFISEFEKKNGECHALFYITRQKVSRFQCGGSGRDFGG